MELIGMNFIYLLILTITCPTLQDEESECNKEDMEFGICDEVVSPSPVPLIELRSGGDDIKNFFGFNEQDLKSLEDEDAEIVKEESKSGKRKPLILKRIVEKLKIKYGHNDRPIKRTVSSIKAYLKRFGYIDYVKRLVSEAVKERVKAHRQRRRTRFRYRITFGKLLREDIKSVKQVIRGALLVFQKFFRLNTTGLVSVETLYKMNQARCGLKDLGENRIKPVYMFAKQKIRNFIGGAIRGLVGKIRSKRHTLAGSRWKIKEISYKITRYPTRFRSHDDRKVIDEQIAQAFDIWSQWTPLKFIRMPSNTPSNEVVIDIRWETGDHGDSDPLDGVGKVLAHSYFPQYGGDAHFDDDEDWTIDSEEGSNILVTAVHELGHSLGLDHSDVSQSIMNPIYQSYTPGSGARLHLDDIRAIQLLYGSRTGVPEVPNLCVNSNFDTIYKDVHSESLYVFKGKFYWKVSSDDMTIDMEYPKFIAELFPGIHSNVDAVIQFHDYSHLVFKGESIYKYTADRMLVHGFPMGIKDLFGVFPTYVDAAMKMGEIFYAFKGNQYWESHLDGNDTGPFNLGSKWPGLKPPIGAVLTINNGIYFFKGNSFYRYSKESDNTYKITQGQPPYPRQTALWWFGCYSAKS